MKKLLSVAIILLFFSMIIFPSSGIQIQNNPVITLNRGNTLYVGGNGSGNYTKIQDAIDNASDGDTVFVYDDSSPYVEWHIDIDKSINLIGENKETTIVDGNGTTIFRIVADYVHITGFYIQNSDARGIRVYSEFNNISDNIFYYVNKGIELTSSNNNIINRNKIRLKGSLPLGIKLSSSDNNVISENNLPGWHHVGISLEGSSNNIISCNILNGSYTTGISLVQSSTKNWITKNYISKASDFPRGGIYCYEGTNNFTKNEVRNCGIGMYLIVTSSNIEDNIIVNNYQCAVLLFGNNNHISGNIIKENKEVGLRITGDFNKIINNAFLNNTNLDPLIFNGGSRNIIEKNNFIDNLGDAYFENSWGNRWSKNYWDKCYNGMIYFIYGIWEIYDPFDMDPYAGPIYTIRYYNSDFRPARKPYEIPDTSFRQGCGIE